MEFEWDLSKEIKNIKKHGISFLDAVEAFYDLKGFQLSDTKHSKREERFYWIGKSGSGKILTVWFTNRENVIRIIGCTEWRKFRRLYYETT